MKILVVEDDTELLDALVAGFAQHQIEVARAQTFEEGWLRMMLGFYSLFILDVMLPGGTGIELCRRARAHGLSTPVLLLTARDAIDDRVAGLEAGADDYVTKPFAFRELLARVRAVLRRPPQLTSDHFTIADLEIDFGTRTVKRAGQNIVLTAKEFALLELFVQHDGRLVDRAMILSHVWDENYDPVSNALEVLVRRLRQKIDDPFEPKLIHTVRNAGYRFGGNTEAHGA